MSVTPDTTTPETVPTTPVPETPTETPKKPNRERFYSIKTSSIDVKGGRYRSSVGVSQAAQKATTQLFRKAKSDVDVIDFTLREVKNRKGTTKYRGKEFQFRGDRKKRENPLVIQLNGKEVRIEYEYKVRMIRGSPSSEETPVEEAPVEEAPMEESPVDESPAEKTNA